MGAVAEVDLAQMDTTQLEEPSIEKIHFTFSYLIGLFLYLKEREKNIENPKDFSEEKEYYKPGEIAAQWSNYEKGRCKIHVPRSDSRVQKVPLHHDERKQS